MSETVQEKPVVEWRDYSNESDWLTERSYRVGASEAAAAIGVSPWCTMLELYMRKRGKLPPLENPRLRWGKLLEPLVAADYSTSHKLEIARPPSICWRADAPWMAASLDYWIPGDRVVEIKTVAQWSGWGEDGSDQIPHHYWLQVQQQMACADLERADVAALCLSTWKPRYFSIERNQPAIDMLREAEREFMERVAREDPPLPDFVHPTTAELLALIEPLPDSIKPLGDEEQFIADSYQQLGEQIKLLEAQRKEAKARLIYAMGEAEEGDLPDGRTIRRRRIDRAGYVVEPTSYLDFRINKPRKGR